MAAYDAGLSTAVSFDVDATRDADRFAWERIGPRLYSGEAGDGEPPPFAIIATDGELYGHHQPFRDVFLARLVGSDLGYDVATLADVVREDGRTFGTADLVEGSSWSCHHGIARWRDACGCVADGGWKAPLRAALDRLAEGIDSGTEQIARTLPGAPDPWAARDAYVDVIVGAIDGAAFAGQWLGRDADEIAKRRFLDIMERTALAPGDVRELRLVLGVVRSDRDRARHPGRGPRRAGGRPPVGHASRRSAG